MKIWFLIQTHKNPPQIYRLVRTIKRSNPNVRILIVHDSTKLQLDMAPLQDLAEVHLMNVTTPVVRADFSLLKPYFAAIEWIQQYEPDFDWLLNISGQDYPVRSIAEIEQFLAHTEYDGFIRYWDALAADSPWGKGRGWKRYFCRYYRFPDWSKPLLERVAEAAKFRKKIKIHQLRALIPDIQTYFTYGAWIGAPVKSSPFNQNFICYGGFAWSCLSRICVEFLQDYLHQNPELIQYYKGTVSPEESLLQTVLVNSKLFNLCNHDKRYFDIHNQPGGHPRTLEAKDYSLLTNDPDIHFARKFDPDKDSEILDLLDRTIFQEISSVH